MYSFLPDREWYIFLLCYYVSFLVGKSLRSSTWTTTCLRTAPRCRSRSAAGRAGPGGPPTGSSSNSSSNNNSSLRARPFPRRTPWWAGVRSTAPPLPQEEGEAGVEEGFNILVRVCFRLSPQSHNFPSYSSCRRRRSRKKNEKKKRFKKTGFFFLRTHAGHSYPRLLSYFHLSSEKRR